MRVSSCRMVATTLVAFYVLASIGGCYLGDGFVFVDGVVRWIRLSNLWCNRHPFLHF